MEYHFIVNGEPKTLKRHRFSKGKTYNPSKQDQINFADSLKWDPDKIISSDMEIEMKFYFERPKSHKKSKKSNHPNYPQKKDLDNLVKFVLDAMNKVVYDDDRRVVRLTAVKEYVDSDAEQRFG
jgi:Holliday junction resolvase RusA-like endonuclease